MDVQIHSFEAASGGSFALTMHDGENQYEIDGTVIEVTESNRLFHTWYVGRVTYELRDVEDGTEILFTHEDLPDREPVEQHEIGWLAALEALTTSLEKNHSNP